MQKKISMLSVLVMFMFIIFSCQAPVSTGDVGVGIGVDAPVDKQLSELTNVPYIGGSLIYNGENDKANHLYAGLIIPVRLGEVESTYDTELASNILVDTPGEATYGFLYIKSIDNNVVSIYYKLYAQDKTVVKEGTRDLLLDQECDLDLDGDNDIVYTTPQKSRRGLEEARYLTFISRQEEKSTTMFSLLPEAFSNNKYPAGIMGVNPEGNLLVKAEDITGGSPGFDGASRSMAIPFENGVELSTGDFVMSGSAGTLSKIESVSGARSSVQATFDRKETDENKLLEAMPLIYFNFEGTMAELEETAGSSRGIVEDMQAYEKKLNEMKKKLNQYHKITLLETKAMTKEFKSGQSYVNFRFDSLKAYIGVKSTFSASWDRVSGSASAVLHVDAAAAVMGKGNISQEIWKQELANLGTKFAIGPVVVGFSGVLTMGVNAGINTNEVNFGFKASAMYGGKASAGANVIWKKGWFGITYPGGINSYFRTEKVEDFNFTFTGTPELKGTAYIKPYFSAGVRIDLYGTLYVQTDAQVSLGPKLTGTVTPNNINIKASLELGVDVFLSSGVKVWVINHSFGRTKILGFNKTLWTKTLYNKPLGKAPVNFIYE